MKNYKLVYVVWEDITVIKDSTWTSLEDRPYVPRLVRQVGYLLKDIPECIQVTECIMDGGYCGDITQIPRGAIRSLLEIPDPKKLSKLKF